MKYLLLLLLWLPAQVAWCQKTMAYAELMKLVSAPGVILVHDSLLMDEAEVSNINWLEHLYFLRKDSTEAQYQAAKPDSLAWARELSFDDPYVTYYLRHPGFRFYPVVGISYEQAVNYCRWRTAKVYEGMHTDAYLQKHPRLRKYNFRVVYRLPTVQEWELAAGGEHAVTYPYGDVFPPVPGSKRYRQQLVCKFGDAIDCLVYTATNYPLNEPFFQLEFNVPEGYYASTISRAFNCPTLDNITGRLRGSLNDGTFITEYVYAHPPNPRGFYNMIGNVAELTATPGIAKGGSWAQSIKTFTLQTNMPYTQPHAWLGFRCAATVYISPKP